MVQLFLLVCLFSFVFVGGGVGEGMFFVRQRQLIILKFEKKALLIMPLVC